MSPIVLQGNLHLDARAQCTRNGWFLNFEFLAPMLGGSKGKPVQARVRKEYGMGDSAGVACRSRANHMRRGVRVIVHAQAAAHMRGAIQLAGIDEILLPDLVVPMRGAGE